MMAPAGVELEMLVSEPDALTTRPPPCALQAKVCWYKYSQERERHSVHKL